MGALGTSKTPMERLVNFFAGCGLRMEGKWNLKCVDDCV